MVSLIEALILTWIMILVFLLSVLKGAVEASLISGVFALVFGAGAAFLGYKRFCEILNEECRCYD
jgi:hypothetical protein